MRSTRADFPGRGTEKQLQDDRSYLLCRCLAADLLTWELGYIFNPLFHRQGYASEAAAAVVAHGFRSLKAHRIVARCSPENPGSWKLLERIGFIREGHFHKSAFFRRDAKGNPIWHDAYEYAMIEKSAHADGLR